MKRLFLLYGFLLMSICLGAQTVTQKGVTYRYNGKNPRTPIGSVTISYDGNKRSVLSDEKSGAFSLTLENLKMGDRIGLVSVKKREMMVFNQHAVDEWSVRKEPLILILCNADEFEHQKANLIEIGKREAKKKYDKQKTELEAKLKASEIQLNEYEAALDKAYEELDYLHKNVDQYADALARIDQSELNIQMQEILDLYIQGDVEDAIKKLKDVKLEEAFEQSLNDKHHHQEGFLKAQEDSIQAVQNIRTAIEICKMNYEWDQVVKYQKLLADKLGTPSELFQYAYYCSKANRNNEEIETYYNKVLYAVKESKKCDSVHLFLYATTMHNLSRLYELKGLIDKAEYALMEGIEGRKQYARMTKNLSDENHVAWSLVTLGEFYCNQKRYKECEHCLKEAESLYIQIIPSYYKGHEYCYGRLFDKMGYLYLIENKLDESEKYYLKSWKEFKADLPSEPLEVIPVMAHILRWGIIPLYSMKGESSYAELFCKELDSICTYYLNIYKGNKQIIEISKANLIDCWVTLLCDARAEEKVAMYNEALEIRHRLAQSTSQANEPYVAQTLYDIGLLQAKMEQYGDAISSFEGALCIFRKISKTNPIHTHRYEGSLYFLSQLYGTVRDYLAAYNINKEWLPIMKKKYEEDSESWQSDYVNLIGSQSFYCIFAKKYDEAEQYSHEGLTVDSTQHWIAANLAHALLFQGKYTEAETIYRRYKDELKNDLLDDLKQFVDAGVIPKEYETDVEKIKKIINE